MNTKTAIKNVADVPNKFNIAGGNVTGDIAMPNNTALIWLRNTDYASISFKSDSDNDSDSYMHFITGDNGNEYFKFSTVNGSKTTSLLSIKSDHVRFKDNVIYHAGNKPTPAEIGALASNGTAVAANKLATARTINGTSFDGTSNITTSNWGTARNLQIGNTSKSVNGSGNVSWSLSEIGAAPTSHTHNYLPLSGGTLTGPLSVNDSVVINGDIGVTGVVLTNNNKGYKGKDSSSVARNLVNINGSNQVIVGDLSCKTLIFSSGNPRYCPSSSVGYDIYHEGNKPTPADIGAIPNSKITISQTAPSNPSTGDLWISW
nr:MAG TPA: Long tail fiber proximal subunit [Caudoviricetes sp.]